MKEDLKKLIRKYGLKKLESHNQYIQGSCAAHTGERNTNDLDTLAYAAWVLGYETMKGFKP